MSHAPVPAPNPSIGRTSSSQLRVFRDIVHVKRQPSKAAQPFAPLSGKESGVHLEGSCHCGKVKFTVESAEPVPFMRCYCSICRKTAGAGGYAINLGAVARSMKVTGQRHLRIYRARIANEGGTGTRLSSARRYFCAQCGSALWAWDPTWPELV